MQERRIDDYWNIVGQEMSDSWTGFTQFTLLSENPPDGYMWSGEETDKTASDIQARSFAARTLERNGKETLSWGRNIKWAIEKPKLDDDRR